MEDDKYREVVGEMASNIRNKLVGGSLFGEQLRIDDVDSMIVAAYNLAKGEDLSRRMSRPRFAGGAFAGYGLGG